MSKGSFSPSIRIWHGYPTNEYEDYTPPGWMWVLAFALRGVEWAIIEADKPEFRKRINEYLKDEKVKGIEGSIKHHYEEIKQLRKELRIHETET